MITVDIRAQIRHAYYVEHKPKRQIAREEGCSRETVDKALASAAVPAYTLSQPRPAPVLGPFKSLIEQLLAENEHLPRKQRYLGPTIFKRLQAEGYTGSESGVRRYLGQQRQAQRRPELFLPLAYDPGLDAQVDWGEAQVDLAGVRVVVQLFVLRLCYSRRLFVRA